MSRLKETAKSILILLLFCSAAYLTVRTWIYEPSILPPSFYEKTGKLFSFFGIELPAGGAGIVQKSGAHELEAAALPIRSAVTLEQGGRHGAEYDKTAVGMILDKTQDLMGEGIGSATIPKEVTADQWRSALKGIGIYYQYLGEIPLSALALWQDYQPPSYLTAHARRVILALEEQEVALYYVNEGNGKYYRCTTAVPKDKVLTQIVDFRPNGCSFAFEKIAMSPHALDEIFLFEKRSGMRTASAAPIDHEEAGFLTLLKTFGISPAANRFTQERSKTMIAVENSRSLTFSENGTVEYHDNREGTGGEIVIYVGDISEAELIESIRLYAQPTAEKFSGDAELYLKKIVYDEVKSMYTVSFDYVLNGIPIMLADSADAATFRIEDGILTYARIHLRKFVLENEDYRPEPAKTVLLLAGKEASEVTDMGVCYKDTTDPTGSLRIRWYMKSNDKSASNER